MFDHPRRHAILRWVMSNPYNLFGDFVKFTDGESGFINGASYSPEESFAEVFAMFHNKDTSIIQEQFPDLYEYMDRLMKYNPEIEEQLQTYLENAYEAIDEKTSLNNKTDRFTTKGNRYIINRKDVEHLSESKGEVKKLQKHAMLYMTKKQRKEEVSSLCMGGCMDAFEHDEDHQITRVISKKLIKVKHK